MRKPERQVILMHGILPILVQKTGASSWRTVDQINHNIGIPEHSLISRRATSREAQTTSVRKVAAVRNSPRNAHRNRPLSMRGFIHTALLLRRWQTLCLNTRITISWELHSTSENAEPSDGLSTRASLSVSNSNFSLANLLSPLKSRPLKSRGPSTDAVHISWASLDMDAADLARWSRFAMKGGIGKCTALQDCVAKAPEDLMFVKVQSARSYQFQFTQVVY